MHFDFASANRIVFEPGCAQHLYDYVNELGDKCLFVVGSGNAHPHQFIEILKNKGIEITVFTVDREPNIEMIDLGVQLGKEKTCDFVIGLGGGSVIDAGKAIAAMLTNDGGVSKYLEIVGDGLQVKNPPKPFIAVPTTAGTGSEVTRNSVLWVKDEKIKVSLRHPLMLPKIAIVDPELTVSVPPDITASTGMDALCQVLEPYVSNRANRMTDLFCRGGMLAVSNSLMRAYRNGNDLQARTDMAWASLAGGLALANSGLGAVHGFAGPIGGLFEAPHGAICARLLPYVIDENYQALKKRMPGHHALSRYGEIAELLTRINGAGIKELEQWILQLCEEMEIPRLSSYGINQSDFDTIVEKSMASSSMKANPIVLERHELRKILEKAL